GRCLAGRSALLRALRIVWLFVCGSRRASRPAKQRRGPMGFCISLLVRPGKASNGETDRRVVRADREYSLCDLGAALVSMPTETATRWSRAAAAGCCILCAATAHAQTYPEKPIRLIVAYAPGGNADTLARIISQR